MTLTYFTLLFSSACTDRHRGGTQLSVSSKAGGLEKGHPLSSEGVCYGVAPSFSWSSSRSPAGVLGVVCPEGGLVYRHTCDVSEPLTCCCLMCCRTGFAPAISRITSFLILSCLVLFTAFLRHFISQVTSFLSRSLLDPSSSSWEVETGSAG